MSKGGDPDLLWPESAADWCCPAWEFLEYGTARVPTPRISRPPCANQERKNSLSSLSVVYSLYIFNSRGSKIIQHYFCLDPVSHVM